jgi:hypothetical protein
VPLRELRKYSFTTAIQSITDNVISMDSARGYEVKKRSKNVKLMWGCRNPEHDKIWLFETTNDAQQHQVESGHKVELLEVEQEP